MNSNPIIKLSNKESYYIVAIAPYGGEKYYLTNHLTNDATELTDDFVVFKEFVKDNKIIMKRVNDDNLIFEILNYLGFYN